MELKIKFDIPKHKLLKTLEDVQFKLLYLKKLIDSMPHYSHTLSALDFMLDIVEKLINEAQSL